MAKDLEEALVNIETKLSGAEKPHMDLGGHLSYIEDLLGKSSGTKLYKHILYSSNIGYKFTLITTNPQPIDFTNINTYKKLYEYLTNENVIQFSGEFGNDILYDLESESFSSIQFSVLSDNTKVCIPLLYDDWPLSETTDTVTQL